MMNLLQIYFLSTHLTALVRKCNGLGMISEIDISKIIPNQKISIKKGAIAPIGPSKGTWIFKQIEAIGD